MATDIGRVGMRTRGTWSSSSSYEVLDVVLYNNGTYIARQNVPTNTPPSNTTYWQAALVSGLLIYDYSSISLADALLEIESLIGDGHATNMRIMNTGDTVNGTMMCNGSYRSFLGVATYNGTIYSCTRFGSSARWTIKTVTPT